MAQVNTKDFSTLPVGRLGLIPLQSCSSLGAKVNDWLVKWRAERQYPGMDSFAFEGYKRDSYIIEAKTPRFGSGEGKCTINESVRGDDIYVMVDVTNYSLSYPIGPYTNLMSPDGCFFYCKSEARLSENGGWSDITGIWKYPSLLIVVFM